MLFNKEKKEKVEKVNAEVVEETVDGETEVVEETAVKSKKMKRNILIGAGIAAAAAAMFFGLKRGSDYTDFDDGDYDEFEDPEESTDDEEETSETSSELAETDKSDQ